MAACNAERTRDVAKPAKKDCSMSHGSIEHGNGLSFSTIINESPMLSEKEQTELLGRKGTSEWPAAREKLVLSNLRLVTSIAKKYAWMDGCSFDDIMSHGVIGLMKALDRFDPEAGAKLSTYGTKWIKQEIRDELLYKRGQIRNPAYMEKLITKMKRCQEEFSHEGVRNPAVWMLAERMGLPEKKVQQLLDVSKMGLVSMDAPVGDEVNASTIESMIPSAKSVEDEAVEKITLNDVAAAIRKLKPIEQKVIMMRFGFIGGRPMTLEECARETGYSLEGCRHIQQAAVRKLQEDYLGRKRKK